MRSVVWDATSVKERAKKSPRSKLGLGQKVSLGDGVSPVDSRW
jgi:hypothetical protein